jgi:hypothetical protein
MKRAKEWGDELENGTVSVAEIYRVDVQNWTKFILSMGSTQFNTDWYQKFFLHMVLLLLSTVKDSSNTL